MALIAFSTFKKCSKSKSMMVLGKLSRCLRMNGVDGTLRLEGGRDRDEKGRLRGRGNPEYPSSGVEVN